MYIKPQQSPSLNDKEGPSLQIIYSKKALNQTQAEHWTNVNLTIINHVIYESIKCEESHFTTKLKQICINVHGVVCFDVQQYRFV